MAIEEFFSWQDSLFKMSEPSLKQDEKNSYLCYSNNAFKIFSCAQLSKNSIWTITRNWKKMGTENMIW